jgi:hypothetical protein
MITNKLIRGKHRVIDLTGVTHLADTIDLELDKKIENFLGAQDYLLYKQAQDLNDKLWLSYMDQNLIQVEILYENVFIPELNDNFDIEMGYRTKLSPGITPAQISLHPEYAAWEHRFPPELFQTN